MKPCSILPHCKLNFWSYSQFPLLWTEHLTHGTVYSSLFPEVLSAVFVFVFYSQWITSHSSALLLKQREPLLTEQSMATCGRKRWNLHDLAENANLSCYLRVWWNKSWHFSPEGTENICTGRLWVSVLCPELRQHEQWWPCPEVAPCKISH